MQIRRYTGPDLPEVLDRVHRELGANAAILNTRRITEGGLFGLLGKPGYEVTVAVDYDFRLAEDAGNGAHPELPPSPASGGRVGPRRPSGGTIRVPEAGGRPPVPSSRRAAGAFPRPPEDPLLAARRELADMRVKPRGAGPASEPGPSLSEDLERVYRQLVRHQVEADTARQLLRVFDDQLALLGEDWTKAQPRFEKYLAGMIRTAPGIQLREGRKPLVAMFIGPTGVGKTTTIAKIATHFSLHEHRRVAIVTADTFRMAATDQIRRYGDILGVPVHVVETPEDMEDVMAKLAGVDLVLVDTAGRSPQNREQILQMRGMVEAAKPDEIHLVISLTTKYVDVMSIIGRFGLVPVNRVILTKVDETKHYGLVLNISMKFSMFSIAYVTTGQAVPDDLEAADPARLAKLVLEGAEAEHGRTGRAAP